MNEYFITKAISAFIPDLTYEVPYLGAVDFTPFVAATTIFVLLTIVFWLIRRVVLVRLKAFSAKTAIKSDDVIIEAVENIHVVVYTLVALYLALQPFDFSSVVDQTLSAVFYVAITWQGIRILAGLVKYFAESRLKEDENGTVDPNAATAANMVTLLAKIVLWSLGGLFVLSNLGIEVTSLIAGLGIGGIAIAFALQGILSDLFSSFSLYFDKPFRIGDHIVIGTDAGTVEKIGIKTTRIRTLQGEELVVSNAELTTVRVQNFKKLQRRRHSTTFGVTYETHIEKLEQIKSVVVKIFDDIETADLDRVFFTTMGDFSLNFEVVYYTNSPEMKDFLTVQEKFNFALFKKFAELGIDFAYPTQVIYSKQD